MNAPRLRPGDPVADRHALVLEMRRQLLGAGFARDSKLALAVEWFARGLTVPEVAAKLGCSPKCVTSHLSRARGRGVALPLAAELGQSLAPQHNAYMRGWLRPGIRPEVARKLCAMAPELGLGSGPAGGKALAERLLAALADEPVLVANLLDEEGAP
ncbi:MAG: hypothetical protein Tsb0020_54370 [Haliangiales bacterium]